MLNRRLCLLGLTSTFLGCAASDIDTNASAIAIAGDWVPPAATLARSNPQHVTVTDPPAITGTCDSTCPNNVWGLCRDMGCTGLMPGTLELQRYIQGRWNFVGAGGNYSCRRNSNPASCNYLSVHSVGRAIDLMIPTIGGDADNTAGDAVANWLIENAEYIGIQRVIWDGKYWNGSRVNNHFSDISDTRCGARYCTDHHVNHIHAELSVEGASRRTRFFTMGAPPMTCPVVCYGNAAVRADCSFTDCAAMGQVCVPDPPRCASSETPASVRNPAVNIGAATLTGGLVRYQPVAPARLFDSRTPEASTQLRRSDGTMAGPLGPMREGTFSSFPGLPAGASGVWLNLAAVPLATPGFVSVFPTGTATNASIVNYTPPTPRANAVAVALGAGGGVTFRALTDSNLIGDLTGAFAPTGMGLRAITPTRVVDTRALAPLGANARVAVPVNAPMGARGVVASVAVIPRGTPGFLQAFPCDAMVPPTSNINFGAMGVVSNTVLSPIAGGQLCFQANTEVDVIVDVTGYLVDAGELSLQLVRPLRIVDTRQADSIYTGRLGGGQVIEVPIAAIPGLPADARAAVVNVTSVDSAQDGFFTVYPCGMNTPNTSSLNYQTGVVGGATVVSSLGTGKLCIYSLTRSHLIADLYGVWVPTPGSMPSGDPPPVMDMPEDPGMDDPDATPDLDATAPPSDARGNMTDARVINGGDGPMDPVPALPGCGCTTPATPSGPRGALAIFAAMALAMVGRRRKN